MACNCWRHWQPPHAGSKQHAEHVDALNIVSGARWRHRHKYVADAQRRDRRRGPRAVVAAVAERVEYWAMMRGRGNSGIILSQVLRGVTSLAGHTHMGAPELAEALAQASLAAYKAVLQASREAPCSTVMREASEAATAALARPHATLRPSEAAVQGARASVDRAPTLLKTLRDAGVVDSGGEGLFLILRGMLRYVRGKSLEYTDWCPHRQRPSAFRTSMAPTILATTPTSSYAAPVCPTSACAPPSQAWASRP